MKNKFGYVGEFHELHGGEQYIFKFENGFGASVIKHQYSYGFNDELWELAVLGSDGDITYESGITKDVIGHLEESEVEELLNDIKSL